MIDAAQIVGETWRAVPGFPGYEVSDFGRVRSFVTSDGRSACPKPAEAPHLLTPFWKNGSLMIQVGGLRSRRHQRGVAGLILEAFGHGKPWRGRGVAYYDGDRGNLRLSNLSYAPTASGRGLKAGASRRP